MSDRSHLILQRKNGGTFLRYAPLISAVYYRGCRCLPGEVKGMMAHLRWRPLKHLEDRKGRFRLALDKDIQGAVSRPFLERLTYFEVVHNEGCAC
jgi:hypothetical protein